MVDWEELAKEALGEKEKPVAANSPNASKIAGTVAAALGVIGVAAVALIEPLESKPAAEMICIAAVAAAAILAVAWIAASDFRTRGLVTNERHAALAKLATASMTRPSAASERSAGGTVPATLKARAAGHDYDVLAVRWEGKPADASYWFLLWKTGEPGSVAKWFSADEVDRVTHSANS